MTGTVQRAADRLRINVQLADATTETMPWTERFDETWSIEGPAEPGMTLSWTRLELFDRNGEAALDVLADAGPLIGEIQFFYYPRELVRGWVLRVAGDSVAARAAFAAAVVTLEAARAEMPEDERIAGALGLARPGTCRARRCRRRDPDSPPPARRARRAVDDDPADGSPVRPDPGRSAVRGVVGGLIARAPVQATAQRSGSWRTSAGSRRSRKAVPPALAWVGRFGRSSGP